MEYQNWVEEKRINEARISYSKINRKLSLYNNLFSKISRTKVSLLNLFDDSWQYTVSNYGEWNTNIIPRGQTYCNKTISGSELLELKSNTLEESKLKVYFPSGELVQYYVGVPIKRKTGENFATICAMDHKARSLSDREKKLLKIIANQLEFTLHLYDVKRSHKEFKKKLNKEKIQSIEIHQKVKKNLSDICGILQLEIDNSNEFKVKEILKKTERRIKVAAMLHELLYTSMNEESVNIKDYTNRLISEFKTVSEKNGMRVTIYSEIDDLQVKFDDSLSIGLILNELLTNSFYHAFKSRSHGIISIEIHKADDGTIWLIIADNGDGVECDKSLKTNYGMYLIKKLVKQINGKFNFNNRGGSVFNLQFK